MDQRSDRLYFISFALVVALLIAPFVQLKYVPFSDYPSHVVRAFILFHYHDVRAFQDTYRIVYEPIPNIASDLLIMLLLRVMSLLTAARAVIIFVVIIYAIGCHLLAAQIHGRSVWIAIPCIFSVYSTFLMWGFINYVLGLGLFMVASSFWLRWKNYWTVPRYLVVMCLVLTSYLTHLSAYILLVTEFVTVCVVDLTSHRTTIRHSVKNLGLLLPPVVLFITFMTGSGTVGYVEWNNLTGKLSNLFALVRSYNVVADVLCLAAIMTSAVILFVGSTRLQPVWPLTITGVVFVSLYAACPLILFTSNGADARFVPPAMLLLVLSIRGEVPRFKGVAVLSILLTVLVFRVILVWGAWVRFDSRINDAVVLADTIPAEARVYPIWYPSDCVPGWQGTLTRWIRAVWVESLLRNVAGDECKKRDIPFLHVLEYAMVNSQIFVPSLHAHKGQQPLIARNDPQYRGSASSNDLRWIELARGYDFVWSYALPDTVRIKLLSVAELVSESGEFRLWKIKNAKSVPATQTIAGGSIKTYYVDPVNGSDSRGNGLLAATAWATLCKADATATLGTNGTVINLLPGAFTLYLQGACVNHGSNSPILGTLNGTPTQRVVWIGQNDPRRSINSTILNGANTSNLYVNSNYNDFIQLEITGATIEFGDNPGTNTLGNYNSLQKSYLHDAFTTCATVNSGNGGFFITSYSSTGGLVDSNVIDNVGAKGGCPGLAGTGIHGIYIAGYHYQVTNNLVSNAAGYGVHSYHNACESNISNNTIVHNYAGGILVSAGPNTSYGCGSNGGNYYTVDNNILYLNSWGCGVIASSGNAGVQGGMIVSSTGASAVNNVGYNNYLISNFVGTRNAGCTASSGTNNLFVYSGFAAPRFIGDPALTPTATTLPAGAFVNPCPSSTWNSTACNVVPNARGGSYDWHLSPSSPFRGIGGSRCAGTPGAVSPCIPTHDLDGAVRLSSTSIGAYE